MSGKRATVSLLAAPGSMMCTVPVARSTDRTFRWTGLTNRVCVTQSSLDDLPFHSTPTEESKCA